jgi:mevalonate kinase
MTTASAPGKIILFGEHAVVYGRPALAVPVTQVRATVEVVDSPDPEIWIDAPDISLLSTLSELPPTHPLAAVISSVFQSLSITPLSSPPHLNPSPTGRGIQGEGLNIKITSTIPVASGLGSGAAVSVAIIRALSAHLGHPLGDEQVSALAYEVEKLHHGTPSGIDNTVITYARPVYFVKQPPSPIKRGAGGEVETFRVGAPFTIVIGDTGISAPTKESVSDVRKLWEADKNRWETVFDKVGEIVGAACNSIEDGKTEELGLLMDANHALLQEMTVSCLELDRLVLAAKSAGALGAKLSGGGRGGNMIALVEKEKASRVSEALQSAGAKRTIITTIQ